jgi:putative DNA-binding protein
MASLRELQKNFAAALRDPAIACAVLPPTNLSIYRNNAGITFHDALALTYPVVRRRVGDDYFRQLAAHYRMKHPSRSGDLHAAGGEFAGFLEGYLEADYAWLADLARLEWSRAECSIAAELPAVGAETLSRFAPEQLEGLGFTLQPALRLHSFSHPIFSVWEANQSANAPPVDQSLGSECGIVRPRNDHPQVLRLQPRLFSFLSSLHHGSPLGAAMTTASLDEQPLLQALAFLFSEALVVSVTAAAE